jgi:solute carrier family 13 (sodium-dependent dicarboxylate transporter), member 2/3/5
MHESATPRNITMVRWCGLLLGPALAIVAYWLLPATLTNMRGEPVDLSEAARALAAVGVLMATWWITEALPIEATALLPLVLFPIVGVSPMRAAAAPYADPIIFLFMGGLILGLSMERWGLHRRIALYTIALVGTRPVMLIGGIMLATAVMSMWVNNTATVVMMLPIGVSIAALVASSLGPERAGAAARFSTCLMLAIAYAASVGGVGTIVGSTPNAILAGIVRREGIEPTLTFATWLRFGLPMVAVFLPISWLILTRVLFRVPGGALPGLRPVIRGMISDLGPVNRGEMATFVVFICAATLWVTRSWIGDFGARHPGSFGWLARLHDPNIDAAIAMFAALALFLIPVSLRRREFAMDWAHAVRIPWGVLVLFGGGLALAGGMTATGLDRYIAAALNVGGLHPLVVVLALTGALVFLTEIASNTAIATTFLPLALVLSREMGVHPYVLMMPLAVACSYAFMMPMGTPPNALVFASGHVNIRQMAGAGILLNLAAIVVITLMSYFLTPVLLGYSPRL